MSVTWGKLKFGALGVCFFEVSKSRAEAVLMRPDVTAGQYLIRPSETNKAVRSAALSVRLESEYRGVCRVQHYEIAFNNDGDCFLEGNEATAFCGVEDLVDYYAEFPLPNSDNTLLGPAVTRDKVAPAIDNIAILKTKVTKGDRLGAGAFGEVFKGKYGRLDVAIKQLERQADEAHESYTYTGEASPFRKEAALLAALSHENIVRLIGVSTESSPFWIITEFMNKGSLDKFLRDDVEAAKLHLEEVYRIFHCIADGMSYLEAKHIIHCDLRTSNVLVHSDDEAKPLEVKVADFGLTKVLQPNQEILVREGAAFPVRWTAPEAIEQGQFSSKSDMWSFGCLAFEVVTLGRLPYPDIPNNDEVARHVQAGNYITLRDCQDYKRPLGTLYEELQARGAPAERSPSEPQQQQLSPSGPSVHEEEQSNQQEQGRFYEASTAVTDSRYQQQASSAGEGSIAYHSRRGPNYGVTYRRNVVAGGSNNAAEQATTPQRGESYQNQQGSGEPRSVTYHSRRGADYDRRSNNTEGDQDVVYQLSTERGEGYQSRGRGGNYLTTASSRPNAYTSSNSNDLCPAELYNLVIARCFSKEPKDRPSFTEMKVKLFQAQYDS